MKFFELYELEIGAIKPEWRRKTESADCKGDGSDQFIVRRFICKMPNSE